MANPVSFAKDIVPTLGQYREFMLWRLDLSSYDDVTANAWRIYAVMIGEDPLAAPMPPAGFATLPPGFITTFQSWISQGFPP